MRQLGRLESDLLARGLVDALSAVGIETKVDAEKSDWLVWVRDEDKLPAAREILQRYLANPQAEEFRAASGAAERLQKERAAREKETRQRVVRMGDQWQTPLQQRARARVTIFLMVLSVAVALLTSFGSARSFSADEQSSSTKFLSALLVVDVPDFLAVKRNPAAIAADTWEFRTWSLRQGELWRLWTPCLIHFGAIHLIFNMLMLYRFGTLLETFVGPVRYALFVLCCGVASNVGGVLPESIGGGWLSGGMSGVIYGLFGWALLLQNLHPSRPMFVAPSTIFMLIAWLLLGFFGFLDLPSSDGSSGSRVANWAHGVGFAFGAAIGYLHAISVKRK